MIRVRAGISFALAEATGQGHCGLPIGELTDQAVALIAVPPDLVATALKLVLAEGDVAADTLEGGALHLPGGPVIGASRPSPTG